MGGFCWKVILADPGLLEGKLHQAFGAATARRVFRQRRSALAARSFGGHGGLNLRGFYLLLQQTAATVAMRC